MTKQINDGDVTGRVQALLKRVGVRPSMCSVPRLGLSGRFWQWQEYVGWTVRVKRTRRGIWHGPHRFEAWAGRLYFGCEVGRGLADIGDQA